MTEQSNKSMEIVKLDLPHLRKAETGFGTYGNKPDERQYTCLKFDVTNSDSPRWAKVGMKVDNNYFYQSTVIIDTFVILNKETDSIYFYAVIGREDEIVKEKVEKLEFNIMQV